MKLPKYLIILFFLLSASAVSAQDTLDVRRTDTAIIRDSIQNIEIQAVAIDTSVATRHSPRKAAIRSAILPGWGQVYNRKIWKVPIVYTAIGIPIGTFVFNKSWYDRTRRAALMISTGDTANYVNRVHPELHFFFRSQAGLSQLLNFRNEFRRSMDYSILFTLLFWGLNVVDATVDAHLKEFDVSDDISMKVKPVLMPMTNNLGISFVFTIGKTHLKEIKPLPF